MYLKAIAVEWGLEGRRRQVIVSVNSAGAGAQGSIRWDSCITFPMAE